MAPRTIFRIAAVLLLLITGAQAYACATSDACVIDTTAPNSGCDQAGGDNCLCCCHHVVPATAVTLIIAERVWEGPPPETATQAVFVAVPIDHPPQL